MSWSAYSAYKAADVEWADNLPVAWKLVPVKRLIAKVESGTSVNAADVPGSPGEIAVLKTSCVYSGEFLPTENKAVYDSAEMARVTCPLRSETLIVSRMNTPDLVGAAGYVRSSVEDIYLPDRLWQITFNEDADPRWVHYWTKTPSYRDQLKAICVGTSSSMQNISQADFGSLVLALPSRHEQAAIADLLDRETAKIDSLIAKQGQLIATLREDRTATITHTVTKGLDPDVELQDSGVTWLGSVPAHWRQTQLRHLLDRIEQGVSPQAYADLADEGWGVLKSGCVNGGIFTDIQHKKLPDDFEIDSAIVVNDGDLLVCRASGSADLVGSTAIVRGLRYQLILSDKIFRLVPGSLALPGYLEWAMNSRVYREQVGGAISGAEGLANNLPMSALKTFRFPLPPLDEQEQICQYLNRRCKAIDALIVKANEVIDVMREYRSALITDAVTGKIDVRGVA